MDALHKPTSGKELYIAFHPREEARHQVALKHVSDLMAELFPKTSTLVFSSAEEREIVFCLDSPFFQSNDEISLFFHSLEAVFYRVPEMFPHFTHFHNGGTEL